MSKVQSGDARRWITRAGRRRDLRKSRWRPGLESLEARQVPTTFVVNTPLDSVAINLQTGQDSTGHVSLRSAIMAANAQAGVDAILLPAGSFGITIAGANEDGDLRGDLDIKGDLTIQGQGPVETVVDGNDLDRVFEVLGGNVTISGVTIQGGRSGQGGGLLNEGGQVTLSSAKIRNNMAIGADGANGAAGVSGVAAPQPGQNGGTAQGGAIYNARGSVALIDDTIAGNYAIGGQGGAGGAGIGGVGADGMTSTSPGVSDGHPIRGGDGARGGAGGVAQGGGIYNAIGAVLTFNDTDMNDNVARGGPGGQGGAGGSVTGGKGALPAPTGMETEGDGGMGIGGNGGAGGAAGAGEGGAVYNSGQFSLAAADDYHRNDFLNNDAIGGAGGAGGLGGAGLGGRGGDGSPPGGPSGGGTGGVGVGGEGGAGASGGIGFGGGFYNTAVAVLTSSGPLQLTANLAEGGQGGKGGDGFLGVSGDGGNGDVANGSTFGGGGDGGRGGDGGQGQGGAIYDVAGSRVTIAAPAASSDTETVAFFVSNAAEGGTGGQGGAGGLGQGGFGGNGAPPSVPNLHGRGGDGGDAQGGMGAPGGSGGLAEGGALFNAGNLAIVGITLSASWNEVLAGKAGDGGTGGNAVGGLAGYGQTVGIGGNATGGDGGMGGTSGDGLGGFAFNVPGGTLLVDPRQGALAGSAQSLASSTITQNQAFTGAPGGGGAGGTAYAGGPFGHAGVAAFGRIGSGGYLGRAVAGGLYLSPGGIATPKNTTVSGNKAPSSPDVFGTYST